MSEIARLRQQIDLEIQSLKGALQEYRITSRHDIITHHLANISGILESLPDGADKQKLIKETLAELEENA